MGDPEEAVRPSAGRGVLEGAFALLEAVRRAEGAGLTALAADSGLPKATAHRLLDQLVGLGAVERSGGRYRIGPRVFQLGQGWRPYPGLWPAAQAPMRELARMTGATVSICTLSEGQTLVAGGILGEVDGLAPMRPGTLWPWSTAAGKLLVAGALPEAPLGPLPGSWRREATAILDRGICFDHEGIVAGVTCVAAPVRSPDGQMVAALTVVAEASRGLPRLADTVVGAGRTISRALR